MANTPVLLHANDEHIHAETYLKGIKVYKEIIERLGNAEYGAIHDNFTSGI